MKNILPTFLIFTLPLIIIATNQDILSASPARPSGEITKIETKDWATISYNKYRLENNVFNKFIAPRPYNQAIFLEKIDGKIVPGWQWDWPGCIEIASFPEIIYGNRPWDSYAEVTEFPVKVGAKRITVDYDINLKVTQTYQMSFLLWVVSSLPASYKNITHEIYITINSNLLNPDKNLVGPPLSLKIGEVKVNNHVFDVYSVRYRSGRNPKRPICKIEFISKDSLLKDSLDISAFLQHLQKLGVLSSDLYITDLELGTRIVGGTGLVELRNYSIYVR